jgi:TonB-dependent SusC/RagA subfamily outer membrane receptor
MKKLKLKTGIFACLLLVSSTVMAQKKAVTGTVKDSSGETLIGVSIRVVETTQGTITGVDGEYKINVPDEKAVLEFSYISYVTQQITVGDKTVINVILQEDTKTLEEVVVVGFGTQKKVNLTGAVGVATAKEIESRPVNSATQALQGLVPGLKISTSNGALDQTMDISVRGTGTIGSSSGSPLILIDGMEGDIHTVNPQDIENISVLKDAAASSIYGSRAPFGVILVTTKKGKAGKVAINYNNSFRYASPLGLPESMDS